MTTHHRLTAKRVDAVLNAAIYGAENMNDDETISEQEYEAIIATIQLLHRRFVAGQERKKEPPMTTIRISANALHDHIDRLYSIGQDKKWHHVDQPSCIIVVNEWDRKTVTAGMTPEAVQEFIEDMKYQMEFMEGQYQAQCKRAVLSVMKQIGVAQ